MPEWNSVFSKSYSLRPVTYEWTPSCPLWRCCRQWASAPCLTRLVFLSEIYLLFKTYSCRSVCNNNTGSFRSIAVKSSHKEAHKNETLWCHLCIQASDTICIHPWQPLDKVSTGLTTKKGVYYNHGQHDKMGQLLLSFSLTKVRVHLFDACI